MFVRKKNDPPGPSLSATSNLKSLDQNTEFLEGRFQGLPEEKKRLLFVIPDTPRAKIILISFLIIVLFLAAYLTAVRAGLNPASPESLSPVKEEPPSLVPSFETDSVPSEPSSSSAITFPAKKVFWIEKEGDVTKVVFLSVNGETEILREYLYPASPPARTVSLSPQGGFLVVSLGTSMTGLLEVINLENEEMIAAFSGFSQFAWVDEGKLVYNSPESLETPRPYEGGEGFSLSGFNAATLETRIIKKADKRTDYILERVEKKEIHFKKVVAGNPTSWTKLAETHWRINFEGNIEEQIN